MKAQSLSDYHAQRRGGKGKAATKMKDEDFVDQLFIANSHDTVLCFSSSGKVHWLKVYDFLWRPEYQEVNQLLITAI